MLDQNIPIPDNRATHKGGNILDRFFHNGIPFEYRLVTLSPDDPVKNQKNASRHPEPFAALRDKLRKRS